MKRKIVVAPTVEQLENELQRERSRNAFRATVRSTVNVLALVVTAAVLVSMLALPVMRVVGDAMSPGFGSGDIVVALRYTAFERGDVIAFYYNNKILIKRMIAAAGDWVDISEDGTVSVNGQTLDEPYVKQKALGDCNIDLPYRVPEGKIFVMGDKRTTSSDSRNTAVGCVAEEQIVGRIRLRIWPLNRFGFIQ